MSYAEAWVWKELKEEVNDEAAKSEAEANKPLDWAQSFNAAGKGLSTVLNEDDLDCSNEGDDG